MDRGFLADDAALLCRRLTLVARDHAPADALKSFLGSYPGRVLVSADSPGRREALLEILHSAGLQPEVLPQPSQT